MFMIKEYWNLIGQEPFLAITWELNFSQEYSFSRVLMNHNNFYFTQIPDKTNDKIFLKSPKTMCLGHFWPFLVIFVRDNSEKTYGQTDGRTPFHRALPAKAWCPIIISE